MNRILLLTLIAITAGALNGFAAPVAKADAKFFAFLPVFVRGDMGMQQNTPTPTPEPTPTPVDPTQLKADVITAVNVERQKAVCALVTENVDLGNGAQAWADYLVAHNALGHSFALNANWYVEHGYTRTDWGGENVAGGTDTGAQTVALWMNDEAHKNVILVGCANTNHIFDIGIGWQFHTWVMAIGELHN